MGAGISSYPYLPSPLSASRRDASQLRWRGGTNPIMGGERLIRLLCQDELYTLTY
jgi:hypothetical protein